MEDLLRILSEVKPGVDFEKEDDLIVDHVLDSFSITMLVANLNDEFDIEITLADLTPENFKNAKTLWAMIERLQDE